MFLVRVLILLFIYGCSNPFTSEEATDTCSGCKLEISADLPQDENGVYILHFNENMVQTFTTVYADTDCGWSRRIQWDTNYQYRIGTDWVSLINPASMTDEDGNGRIIFGAWKEFIGYTVGCYGGYVDDCEEHHIDSLFIKII